MRERSYFKIGPTGFMLCDRDGAALAHYVGDSQAEAKAKARRMIDEVVRFQKQLIREIGDAVDPGTSADAADVGKPNDVPVEPPADTEPRDDDGFAGTLADEPPKQDAPPTSPTA